MVHGVNRKGEPLPEGYIEKRQAKVNAGKKKRLETLAKTRPTEGASAKVFSHSSNYYAKLAAQGIFRCPECSQIGHKRIDFTTALQLGKHRRFKHGVVSPKKLKEAADLEAAARLNNAPADAPPVQAPLTATEGAVGRVICQHCFKSYKNAHGLSIHMKSAHSVSLVSTPNLQEITNGNGSTERTAEGAYLNGHAQHGRSNDAAYVTALAVADLTGHIQSLILAASNEYDLPPRQLARRCILALSERYST
jgi:hypothetical protein